MQKTCPPVSYRHAAKSAQATWYVGLLDNIHSKSMRTITENN